MLLGINNAGTRLEIWDLTSRKRDRRLEKICAAHQILLE